MNMYEAITFLVRIFVYALLATGIWYLLEQAVKAHKKHKHLRVKQGETATVTLETISQEIGVEKVTEIELIGRNKRIQDGLTFVNSSGYEINIIGIEVSKIGKLKEGEYFCTATICYKIKGKIKISPAFFICYTD